MTTNTPTMTDFKAVMDRLGGPAFPLVLATAFDANGSPSQNEVFPGMTLRDWFAGQAISGFVQNRQGLIGGTGSEIFAHEDEARRAYRVADAMIKARSE